MIRFRLASHGPHRNRQLTQCSNIGPDRSSRGIPNVPHVSTITMEIGFRLDNPGLDVPQ